MHFNGLNDQEVEQSRRTNGSNAIPDSEPTTFWAEFKETFGDPMIKIDRSEIAAAGHPDCVVLAVSNTAEYASVTMTAEADAHVDAGAAVVEVAK